MSTGWGQVRQWRSAPVEAALTQATQLLDDLLRAGDALPGLVSASWRGRASEGAAGEVQRLRDLLEDRVTELSAVRRGLAEAADALTGVERVAQDAIEFAAAHELSIDDAGTVHDARPAELVVATEDAAATSEMERRRVITECAMLVEHSLRRAAALDSDLCRVLRQGVLSGALSSRQHTSLSAAAAAGWAYGADGLVAPPAGDGTAAENAAWWVSLSDAQQREILQQHPEWLGNRDGIPFAVRDQANRARLPGERVKLEQELAALRGRQDSVWDDLFHYREINSRIAQVQHKLDSLDAIDEMLARPDRHLLGLDMSHARAQAIVAVGDVDAAGHVAVFTPGLTSTVQGMGGYDTKMQQLRDRALQDLDRHGSTGSVATVTWLGYQAPQLGTTFSGNSVATAGTALGGGNDLAEFFRGINASRPADEPDLTALGHSYGSTTTGYALHETTGVDRAAFYGSPGLGVDRADQLQVPVNGMYYAEAKWDGVGDLRRFGADPTTMPGMHQMETGAAHDRSGRPLDGVTLHSAYMEEGSTSQYNLAAVVAGHPEDVITGTNYGVTDQKQWWAPWTA